MKVYGMSYWKAPYTRVICYCRSQKEFARLLNTSLYHVRQFACVTHNEKEIVFAKKYSDELILVKDDGTMQLLEKEKRLCSKCGRQWTDFELMTEGGIEVGSDGDIAYLKCPSCGAELSW